MGEKSNGKDYPNNLLYISEHNDQNLFNCLSSRLLKGKNYTLAVQILISTQSEPAPFTESQREAYTNPLEEPHLYTISSKVYKNLKSTSQNQVISLLGYSGSGKTFAAVHLIDHLCYLSSSNVLFPLVHASVQIIHVMGSVFSPENGESSICGLVTNLLYDQEYQITGAQIKSKLLDYTLPYSPNGHTYHILHALVTASKMQLKSLGLGYTPNFKIFQNRVPNTKESASHGLNFDRFLKNMQLLKFSRAEIQEVLEMFSLVILMFEISFVGSQFVVAGEKEFTEWTPRHRSAVQKVCKILLISEDKFLEIFQGIQHKSLVEGKIRELARTIYLITFEWVQSKINERLKILISEEIAKKGKRSESVYQISIIDFPGFHRNTSLGGFCTNLSLECLNLFAADKLIELLNRLQEDKISMNIMTEPVSRDMATILMSKEFGLIQSLDIDNFDMYWAEFRSLTKDNKQIVTSNTGIVIKYVWGEIEYDINQLRAEARKFCHPSDFSGFLNKCSNNLLKKVITPPGLSLSETFRKDISILLEPLIGVENSLIYFLKSSKGKLDYNETIRVLRNTLILPCLYWEWYGYHHWINNSKLLNDLGITGVEGKVHSFITTLLNEFISPDDFLVGLRYTLLKDTAFQLLDEKCCDKSFKFPIASKTKAAFEALSPKSSSKLIRARSSKMITESSTAFSYKCYGEFRTVPSGIYDFLDNIADINEMSFRRDTFSRVSSSKLSNCSSTSSFKDTMQTVRSKKHFSQLKKSLSNFKLLSYSEQLYFIIKIQSYWKGYQARKYYNAYLLLKNKASKIQATWKAYKQRTRFNSVLAKIKTLQKFFKKLYFKKKRAASVIQKWYRKLIEKSGRIEDISSEISSIANNNSLPFMKPEKRSLLKPTQIKHPEETFKPNICKNSRNLAKSKEDKMGSSNLPVEKRLEMMYLYKKNKLEDLRKNKIEEERVMIKPSPSINKSKEFNFNFLERQEQKTHHVRMKKEKEILKKQTEEYADLTFRPNLISKNSKSLERSVKDLQVWAEAKKFHLSRAQKIKAEEEARSISPFQMSSNSKRILLEKQAKVAEQIQLANELRESLMPYWPNKTNTNQ